MDNEIVFIYGLKDPITDEIRYIGKSINPKERYIRHISDNTIKYNTHLFRWVKKLKNNGLLPILEIIKETTNDKCDELEKYYITTYPNLVNIHLGGNGGRQPPEIREKISKSLSGSNHFQYGIPRTKETKFKISETLKGRTAWNKGIPHAPETCQKISDFWKGKTNNKWTEESRNKARQNTLKQLTLNPHPMSGKHHTQETKQKLSLLHQGKKLSLETRLKMSKSGKGRKKPIGFGEKISKALKGKSKSKEHKKNLSISKLKVKNDR